MLIERAPDHAKSGTSRARNWFLNFGAPAPVLSSKSEHDHSLLLSLLVLHYSMIFASLFVCPDRRVLKLPRLLPGWWRSVPLQLPRRILAKAVVR